MTASSFFQRNMKRPRGRQGVQQNVNFTLFDHKGWFETLLRFARFCSIPHFIQPLAFSPAPLRSLSWLLFKSKCGALPSAATGDGRMVVEWRTGRRPLF
jgi:hypothetical protein